MYGTKAFLYVILWAVAFAIQGLDAAPALGQPVGAGSAGSCGMIVAADGDIFLTWVEGARTCDFPPHPWLLRGNVFASAGRGATSPLVGMNQNWQMLAANGDWFQLGVDYNYCNGAGADFLGNVFEQTGVRVPDEEFVTFGGGGPSGGNEYAATNRGNVYRWDSCTPGSAWSYIGALPGYSPVSTNRASWGKLKVVYR